MIGTARGDAIAPSAAATQRWSVARERRQEDLVVGTRPVWMDIYGPEDPYGDP